MSTYEDDCVLYDNLITEKSILRSVPMSDKMWDVIRDKIYVSYKNACIMWIFEVCNKDLENDQAALKVQLEDNGPVETLSLFHGTKSYLIEKIASEGFNVTKNTVSAYGKGTYAAQNANLSVRYVNIDSDAISYLFLVDMLVGRKQIGTKIKKEIDTNLYDNYVDNITKPSIYVTPYNAGCIPKYVIAFHKNAK